MSTNLIQNNHRWNVNPEPSNLETFVLWEYESENSRVNAFRKEPERLKTGLNHRIITLTVLELYLMH